jgi:hypothetical protein
MQTRYKSAASRKLKILFNRSSENRESSIELKRNIEESKSFVQKIERRRLSTFSRGFCRFGEECFSTVSLRRRIECPHETCRESQKGLGLPRAERGTAFWELQGVFDGHRCGVSLRRCVFGLGSFGLGELCNFEVLDIKH